MSLKDGKMSAVKSEFEKNISVGKSIILKKSKSTDWSEEQLYYHLALSFSCLVMSEVISSLITACYYSPQIGSWWMIDVTCFTTL